LRQELILSKRFCTVFSDQTEQSIKRHLLARDKVDNGISERDLLISLFFVLDRTRSIPGSAEPSIHSLIDQHPQRLRGWMRGFLRRTGLRMRKPTIVDPAVMKAINPTTVESYLQVAGELIAEYNIKPRFIVNVDETKVKSEGTIYSSKVFSDPDKHGNAKIPSKSKKAQDHATLLVGVSAVGFLKAAFVPPLTRVDMDLVCEGTYGDNRVDMFVSQYVQPLFDTSGTGFLTSAGFFDWFEQGFLPEVNLWRLEECTKDEHILLVFDGNQTHISLAVAELAIRNNVHIVVLPAHSTSFLQACDVKVFKTFHNVFRQRRDIWNRSNTNNRIPTHKELMQLIAETFHHLPAALASEAMKIVGLSPWNPDLVRRRFAARNPAYFNSSTRIPINASAFAEQYFAYQEQENKRVEDARKELIAQKDAKRRRLLQQHALDGHQDSQLAASIPFGVGGRPFDTGLSYAITSKSFVAALREKETLKQVAIDTKKAKADARDFVKAQKELEKARKASMTVEAVRTEKSMKARATRTKNNFTKATKIFPVGTEVEVRWSIEAGDDEDDVINVFLSDWTLGTVITHYEESSTIGVHINQDEEKTVLAGCAEKDLAKTLRVVNSSVTDSPIVTGFRGASILAHQSQIHSGASTSYASSNSGDSVQSSQASSRPRPQNLRQHPRRAH
jgi:hypothetical protein